METEMLTDTQRTLARDAEAKLLAASAACEALKDHERTNVVAVHVAFTGLTVERVARWQSTLNEIEAGTRSTAEP
jgi:hypothetical protein